METSFLWFGVFSGSFGVQSVVLCKCSGNVLIGLRKQDSASQDLGRRVKKNGTFLNHNAFRRVKAVTTGGTENGLKKDERYDSAYDQARKEPVPSHTLQENSQARFFQLDTTTARRNQPVKRQSVLRQAPRGRGKRRPAQAG